MRGSRFRVDPETAAGSLTMRLIDASEFVLDGPKELLRQLEREHDGHQDQITGIAVVPGSRQRDGDVTVKDVGKTRITAGAGSSTTDETSTKGALPVRLKVQSLTHLADTCSTP